MILRMVKAAIRRGKGPAPEAVHRDGVISGPEKTDGCLVAGKKFR